MVLSAKLLTHLAAELLSEYLDRTQKLVLAGEYLLKFCLGSTNRQKLQFKANNIVRKECGGTFEAIYSESSFSRAWIPDFIFVRCRIRSVSALFSLWRPPTIYFIWIPKIQNNFTCVFYILLLNAVGILPLSWAIDDNIYISLQFSIVLNRFYRRIVGRVSSQCIVWNKTNKKVYGEKTKQ